LLGTVSRDELDPELAAAIAKLEKGKVSEPVKTATGFHLLRVDDRTSAGHKKVEEVSDAIKESLYNQNLEKRFQEWLTHDLRERHHVEVLE
jgi:parvulin-like peptidyl-prolyl isomerase